MQIPSLHMCNKIGSKKIDNFWYQYDTEKKDILPVDTIVKIYFNLMDSMKLETIDEKQLRKGNS